MKNKYGLLFKTGDSEIRALRNFSNKKGIFPIIELTRGRKTKKDTIGDIQKRIDQLAECWQHGYYFRFNYGASIVQYSN